MSASVGDMNIHPDRGLVRSGHMSPGPTPEQGSGAPSPLPAPIMSDATESSESTSARSVPSPPVLRKRGSSWSLAADGKQAVDRKRKTTETSQGSSTEENADNQRVPQHETLENSACRIEFSAMARLSKDVLLKRLTDTSIRGNLTMINFSRRGLGADDADLVKQAIHRSPHLTVLKLSYNNLGDEGTATIASAFVRDNRHHGSLSVLDLGFNGVGEEGCSALALHAVAGNFVLRTLCLTGNNVREKGALSLAGAILHGSSLGCLHLSANNIGVVGAKALTRAIAEGEGRHQAAVASGNDGPAAAMGVIQELHLNGTGMGSAGVLSVTNMMLTNFSLRVLCLSDNGIDDNDMALFAQCLGQNKSVPLEVLQLSFNQISCLGIECLMNAVWGSKTLREMRLDHNRISDRGAQLAAVVLTSIDLEVLDLGFNRIGSLGIKAVMKSLSENSSLQSLVLSGIPLDPASSKAVCYALAYNTSLRSFHVDSCSIGYAAQRHIVAGIVSNQHPALRFMTGFRLGAITVTLGLPTELENWTNDQILAFVRLMWPGWREQRSKNGNQIQRLGNENGDVDGEQSLSTNVSGSEGQRSANTMRSEPADPKTVVSASKLALASLGESGGEALHSEPYQREKAEASPLIPVDATILERTTSGTVQVPSLPLSTENGNEQSDVNGLGNDDAFSRPSGSAVASKSVDSENRRRNLQWLRRYYWVLSEIAQLPFNDTDFWQLQRHFYSPSDGSERFGVKHTPSDELRTGSDGRLHIAEPSPNLQNGTLRATGSVRKSIYTPPDMTDNTDAINNTIGVSIKRLSSAMKDSDDSREPLADDMEPATKRSKNSELQISHYPRIWEKLEFYRAKNVQDRALALMRQLRFAENELGLERSGTNNATCCADNLTRCDVEMILLDLI